MSLFARLGCVLAGLGVAFGAFGAHALQDHLAADRLAIFETAVRYQMYHALALLAVALARTSTPRSRRVAAAAGWAFVAGILLFSGSLYLLVLTGTRAWGAITPIGGIVFLAGWMLLALAFVGRPWPDTPGGR